MTEAAESTPTVRPPERRKLIAVVYADMVGYSRLIGLDDAGTLARLKALRANLIDPAIAEHGGRVVQTGGDSLLIVFDSIDGAVRREGATASADPGRRPATGEGDPLSGWNQHRRCDCRWHRFARRCRERGGTTAG